MSAVFPAAEKYKAAYNTNRMLSRVSTVDCVTQQCSYA